MTGTPIPTRRSDAGRYEIRLATELDASWSAWFDGLTVTREAAGTTVLTGQVADQAVLHGLLQRIRDLNVPLVSVCRVDPANPCPSRRLP